MVVSTSHIVESMDANNSRTSFGGVDIIPVRNAETMGICMAIYGAGGVGKTTIVGQAAARYGDMLYIDAEGGASAIKHLPNIQLANVTSFRQIENLIKACKAEGTKSPYKSVALDNMSEMQNLCIQGITQGGPVQIQHWGECTAKMLKLTRDVRELSRAFGIHVFYLAWEALLKDDEGRIQKRGVKFTPSFAEQFPGIVTQVGYMEPIDRKPDVRKLTFQVSTKTDAKFRVAPTENAAKIPLTLYVKQGADVLGDVIASSIYNEPFPVKEYAAPATT